MKRDEMIKGLRYKAENIKAHMEPEFFTEVADYLESQKWISIEDRLPEDRKPVLVTAYWHETYQVMMGSYYGGGLWWCVPFNNTGEHEQKLKPKAWMELPKAYKAGE